MQKTLLYIFGLINLAYVEEPLPSNHELNVNNSVKTSVIVTKNNDIEIPKLIINPKPTITLATPIKILEVKPVIDRPKTIVNTSITQTYINLSAANTDDEIIEDVEEYDEIEYMDTGGGILDSTVTGLTYIKSNMLVNYRDSGFYGSVGLSYMYNKYYIVDNERSRNSFMHKYKLGYKGIVYSPKLLDYKIEGLLRYEDTKHEVDGTINEIQNETKEYKVNLNFLKESKIPFRIYANKQERPVTVLYAYNESESLTKSTNLGLSGRINLNILDIIYSVSDSDSEYENIFYKEESDIRNYRGAISKREKKYNFSLNYSQYEQDRKREYANLDNFSTSSKNKNVRLLYNLNISDAIRLGTNSHYMENDTIDINGMKNISKTIYSNLNLSWNPKSKHRATVNVQASNMENKVMNIDVSLKNISFNQNYGYRMNKNLNINQTFNYSVVYASTNKTQSTGLGSSVSYSKPLTKYTRMNLSSSFNVRNNSNDSNSTVSDVTYYSYNAKVGINQMLKEINSKMNIRFGYYESVNTLDELTRSYNAIFDISTKIYSVIRNQLKATYMNDYTELLNLNKLLSRDINRINIEDKIYHVKRVGIRGNIRSTASVRYTKVETNGENIERILPNIGIDFKYRLGPKLMFGNNFRFNKELISDITNYTFKSDLRFRARKTMASIEYNYNKVINGNYMANENSGMSTHSIMTRFERNF